MVVFTCNATLTRQRQSLSKYSWNSEYKMKISTIKYICLSISTIFGVFMSRPLFFGSSRFVSLDETRKTTKESIMRQKRALKFKYWLLYHLWRILYYWIFPLAIKRGDWRFVAGQQQNHDKRQQTHKKTHTQQIKCTRRKKTNVMKNLQLGYLLSLECGRARKQMLHIIFSYS